MWMIYYTDPSGLHWFDALFQDKEDAKEYQDKWSFPMFKVGDRWLSEPQLIYWEL